MNVGDLGLSSILEKFLIPVPSNWSEDIVPTKSYLCKQCEGMNATCLRSCHVPFVSLAFPCMLCSSLFCL